MTCCFRDLYGRGMVNLLIPAALVPRLLIPQLALTTGSPDVIWHDRRWGWRWNHRKVIRLPYDRADAAKLRRFDWLTWFSLVLLIAVSIEGIWWLVNGMTVSWLRLVTPFVMLGVAELDRRWDVAPRPASTGNGDLYLAELPDAVAEQWISANPQMHIVSAAPVYRLFRPRVYVFGAVVCALTAVLAVRTMFDGKDHPLILMAAAPALIIAACVLAYRAIPTGYIREDR